MTVGNGRGDAGTFNLITSVFPSYAELMMQTDGHGTNHAYLANQDRYEALRDLELRNAIVPVVGDFAGDKAIRAIGTYLKQSSTAGTVTAFYTSNVEQYLFQNGVWRAYYDNVATLPLDASSTFIRSFFPSQTVRIPYSVDASSITPVRPGTIGSSTLLCPIRDLLNGVGHDTVRSYLDRDLDVEVMTRGRGLAAAASFSGRLHSANLVERGHGRQVGVPRLRRIARTPAQQDLHPGMVRRRQLRDNVRDEEHVARLAAEAHAQSACSSPSRSSRPRACRRMPTATGSDRRGRWTRTIAVAPTRCLTNRWRRRGRRRASAESPQAHRRTPDREVVPRDTRLPRSALASTSDRATCDRDPSATRHSPRLTIACARRSRAMRADRRRDRGRLRVQREASASPRGLGAFGIRLEPRRQMTLRVRKERRRVRTRWAWSCPRCRGERLGRWTVTGTQTPRDPRRQAPVDFAQAPWRSRKALERSRTLTVWKYAGPKHTGWKSLSTPLVV